MPLPDIISAISVEVLGPIPRRVRQVHLPTPSPTAAASRHEKHVRHTGEPCKTIATGSAITGVQSFVDVQAPTRARLPDRSHRSPQTGRPGRLHHASPEGLPASGCGSATCLRGHLTRLDFHQLDGSLVGYSFSLYALQTMMHSTAYCFSRV